MIVRLPRAPGEPSSADRAAGGLGSAVAQPADQHLDRRTRHRLVQGQRADRHAPDDDGRLTVLGTGQRESRGVKRGYITDMAASEFAVREAVELAERMSGVTVDDVWASYGAGGLVSDVANVEVELGGHQVEQSDIDELLQRRQRRDRPQRPGRAPRPPGALHDRPGAGRPAADRAVMPTGSGSISTSSPPTRRRCATSIR